MPISTAPTSTKTADPTMATTNTNAAENTTVSKQYLKLAGLILGLSTILLLMLLSFVTPLLNSGAKDLPLAVGGPDMVTTKITQGLEAKSPDAFAVTSYSTAEEATEAVRNREAIGAITAGPDGITIVTASAAGTPYSTILKQIGEGLSQTGQPIHYTDVAPLTAKDPSGSAISMLALPMIFGGMSSAPCLRSPAASRSLAQSVWQSWAASSLRWPCTSGLARSRQTSGPPPPSLCWASPRFPSPFWA